MVIYFIGVFGLILIHSNDDFREFLQKKATSLYAQSGTKIDRMALLSQILRSIEKHLDLYQKEGFAPIRQKWLDSACFLGEKVVIRQQ